MYLKAMERKRWAFPLVGVAAARDRRRDAGGARGGRADPVAARGPLDDATPLPRNAYKVDVAKALVQRAETALGQS